MKGIVMYLSIIVVSSAIAFFSRTELSRFDAVRGANREQAEVLYLPTGRGLNFISFGYRNALANILWFNTISYFGKHHASDRNYRWLAHMCDLITTLDPNMRYVYEFGALMLAWEMNNPKEANRLLTKGIHAMPNYWNFYYLRGFNSLYFLNDKAAAERDFERGAELPNAHVILKTLAAKSMLTDLRDPESAIRFLAQMIAQSHDEHEREVLNTRMNESRRTLDLQLLTKAVQIYESRFGRKPATIDDLLKSQIVLKIPPDPFGGKYYIDKATLEPHSTSENNSIMRK